MKPKEELNKAESGSSPEFFQPVKQQQNTWEGIIDWNTEQHLYEDQKFDGLNRHRRSVYFL